MKLHLNADLGERELDHPVDLALLPLIDAMNIACGGHAGDAESVRVWSQRANEANIAIHGHLSYPDREHFGRRHMDLPWKQLSHALDEQFALLSDITTIKWHGALYNDAARDQALAQHLSDWLISHQVTTILAPPQSAMAHAAVAHGLNVLREGFADRRYQHGPNGVALVSRQDADAIIADPAAAAEQVQMTRNTGHLTLRNGEKIPYSCDTWCLHSDHPQAVAIAQRLRALPC